MTVNVTLPYVADLTVPTTAANVINNNSDTITNGLSQALNTSGDSMGGNLDMNSFRILNLPAPLASTDPVRLEDLTAVNGSITINAIPPGGTTGESLQKTSNANYVVGWNTSVSSVGLAMPSDFTVTNSPVASSGNLTAAWAVTPTGTGAVVRTTSPTIATPTITGATISAPTVTGTETFTGSTSGTTGLKASATASGTLTLPAATDTLVGQSTTDTLTNKTLTSPVISTIVNTGTLTLPTSTDTLVGRATTDTLTNKTLTSPVITGGTQSSPSITTPAITGPVPITSNSASALTVGPNGTTNPVLQVIASQASQATGLSIQGNAAGSATSLLCLSTATNESIALNAKAAGTVGIGSASSGGVNIGTGGGTVNIGTGAATVSVTSSGSNSLAVGANGTTNPSLQVDSSTASSATGILVKSAAAAAGVAVSTISSGTNENLTVNAKGSGTVSIGNTSTGSVAIGAGATSGVNITGASNGSNAATGIVGEFVTSTVVIGSAVAITTGTPANVTSISLTAGDWDVYGVACFTPANTTSLTQTIGSISTTSATLNTAPGNLVSLVTPATTYNGATQTNCPIPPVRISISSTTTVYLVAQATFTVSTNGAFGIISARRAR